MQAGVIRVSDSQLVGGTLSTESGGLVQLFGETSLERVAIDGQVDTASGAVVEVVDSLSLLNDSQVTLEPPSGDECSVDCHAEGGQLIATEITGSGELELNDSTSIAQATGTLTIGGDVTVRGGGGSIGVKQHPLIINGKLSADDGRIVVNGSEVSVDDASLKAIDGSLEINGLVGTISDVEAAGQGTITLDGSYTVVGQAGDPVATDGATIELAGRYSVGVIVRSCVLG